MAEEAFEGEWFRFLNWREFPSQWVQLVTLLAERIAAITAQYRIQCIRYNGSYTFQLHNKTIAKLAPQNPANPHLSVGFSSTEPNSQESAQRLGYPAQFVLGPRKERFAMVDANPAAQADAVIDVMTEFLRQASGF